MDTRRHNRVVHGLAGLRCNHMWFLYGHLSIFLPLDTCWSFVTCFESFVVFFGRITHDSHSLMHNSFSIPRSKKDASVFLVFVRYHCVPFYRPEDKA